MSEWKELEIGELSFSYAGGTPNRSKPEYFAGTIPWISSSEVNQSYVSETIEKITEKGLKFSSARWVPQNSVLIAMYGATAGQVAYLKIKATTNQAVLALIPKDSEIDSRFLYYQVNFYKDKILYHAQGSGQPNLSKQIIDRTKLCIPTYLPIQRKIARILSTIDGQIEKTEAIIAKYQAVKQGMLQDLFTRGIDVNTGQLRPRYEDAPDLYQDSPLGMIPKEWAVGGLSSIAEINPPKFYKGLKNEDEVSFIKMEDVSNGGIWMTRNVVKLSRVKAGFTNFRDGDTLVAKITPCLENGKGALVESLTNGVGFGSTEFHVVRPLDEKSKYFVYSHTVSPKFRQTGESQMVGSAGQQRIQKDFFTRFQIGLPPTSEQFEIGNRLKVQASLITKEQQTLAKLQLLKQGLMQDLLSGKVEVTA